jgi:elongation factor P
MKIDANSIRQGDILEYEGKLYAVTKQPMHTQPGKGGAYVQVEMKDVKSGTKVNERFRSADKVEKAHVDFKEYQYLYIENNNLVLMDNDSYEQMHMSEDLLGEKVAFLQEGMMVKVESFNDEAVGVKLPDHITCEIVETEPTMKGQTATSSFKPAILDNGLRIMVPQYIDVGIKVVVRTEDTSFVERAK